MYRIAKSDIKTLLKEFSEWQHKGHYSRVSYEDWKLMRDAEVMYLTFVPFGVQIDLFEEGSDIAGKSDYSFGYAEDESFGAFIRDVYYDEEGRLEQMSKEFDDKYLEKDVKDTEEAIGLVKGYYDTEIEFVMINKKEGSETPIQDCHVSEVIVKKDPNNKFELPKEVTMANTYKEVLETYGNPNMNDEKDGERIVVYMNVKNNYSIMMKFEKQKMTEIRLTSMLH